MPQIAQSFPQNVHTDTWGHNATSYKKNNQFNTLVLLIVVLFSFVTNVLETSSNQSDAQWLVVLPTIRV